MAQLIKAVADVTGVAIEDICGPRKVQRVTLARQLVYYVADRDLNYSSSAIGRAVGRDHSTVISGVKSMARKLPHSTDCRAALAMIREQMGQAHVDHVHDTNSRIQRAREDARHFVRRRAITARMYDTLLPPFELSTHGLATS